MNLQEATESFLAERDRISHGPLKNTFFCALQPCWDNTDRYSNRDVIFQALNGNYECRQDSEQIVNIWKDEVQPELDRLIDNVSSDYGFVVSDEWNRQVHSYRKAAEIIASFNLAEADSEMEAKQRAEIFWNSVDTIKDFVKNIKINFSDFFKSWDASLMVKP